MFNCYHSHAYIIGGAHPGELPTRLKLPSLRLTVTPAGKLPERRVSRVLGRGFAASPRAWWHVCPAHRPGDSTKRNLNCSRRTHWSSRATAPFAAARLSGRLAALVLAAAADANDVRRAPCTCFLPNSRTAPHRYCLVHAAPRSAQIPLASAIPHRKIWLAGLALVGASAPRTTGWMETTRHNTGGADSGN